MKKEWHGKKEKDMNSPHPSLVRWPFSLALHFPRRVSPWWHQGAPPPQWRDPCYTIVLMWTKLETHMVEVHILYYFLDVRALKLLEMGVTSFQRVERLDFSELSIRISLKKRSGGCLRCHHMCSNLYQSGAKFASNQCNKKDSGFKICRRI